MMHCDHLILHLIQRTFCRRVLLLLLIWTLSVNSDKVYTNEFVVYINGDTETAKQLATKHGFKFLGKIFENCYHMKSKRIYKRSISPAHEEHYSSIQDEEQVLSVQQQIAKKRVKRDFLNALESSQSAPKGSFNDPKWSHMWYLNRGHGLDMNVQPVWEQNVTGRDVVVTILDDGLEKDHPDIAQNYDSLASFDVNNHDDDPMPRYDMIDSNRHGTRCAGEVAAIANNSICAIGVAYNAKVGGVRMLDGDVTDAVEARSLSLNPQHIHIYSASWGPDDDGKTVDGPGDLATKAFIEGVTKGRNGLGSIFVWASGNGGREHDNCNCDGYTNSIWTLSISSATENGLVPWYSEACSSTLATTYSSGSYGERQIVTTDLHHGCTDTHTGTSASAPLAAGICALVLEANSNLTWRDMQHIVVHTAKPANLHARDWKTNGIGRNVSHSFGYGLLDAYAMVQVAKNWVTVPQQKTCEVHSQPIDKMIPAKSHVELSLRVHCDNVRFLEHVQARVTLTATRRGDIHIYLTSPAGTRSTLLAQRPMDNSRAGFQNWPFMSVHSWGESPNGDWKLEIHNEGRYYNGGTLPSLLGRATLKNWTIILYGTSEDPDRRKVKTYATVSERARFQTAKPTSSLSPIKETSKDVPLSKETATKGTISPLIPFNSIEDSSSSEVALSDSERNSNHKEEEYLTYHGTRADKSDRNQEHQDRNKGPTVNGGCAFSQTLSLCLECEPGYLLLNGFCVTSCPDGYFATETIEYPDHKVDRCVKCHYSCKQCKGTNDNQCTTCYSDAKLHHSGYCSSNELVQEVVALERWYTAVTVVFLCLCFLILVLVIYIVTEKNPHLLCWLRSSRHHTLAYDGLPLRTAERNSSVLKLSIVEGQTPSAPYRDDHSEDDL